MMMTPIEWIIFGCVILFVLSTIVFFQKLQTTDDSNSSRLRWLSSLERKPTSVSLEPTEQVDRWLHRVVEQSGIGMDLSTFLLANSGAALLAGIIAWQIGLNVLASVLIAMTIFGIGVIIVWLMFKDRNKKFDEQFPTTLELMSTAVSAGECFEDSVEVAEDSTQYPVKQELQHCLSKMALGMPASEAMQWLAYRNPTMDVRLFSHTISVHQEMGGRLGETLQRLANVIQERREINQRIRSATSLGRFAAIMITGVGLAALVYLAVFQPEYVGRLLESNLGRQMVIYAVISEIVGIIWVVLSLDPEI